MHGHYLYTLMKNRSEIIITEDRGFVISNVRMKSAAGHYLGSVWFSSTSSVAEGQPNDRDSMYFTTEEWLEKEYPNSISMKEAYERAEAKLVLYKRRNR